MAVERDAVASTIVGDRRALVAGLLAYGLWGFFPLYFHAIRDVPALEIVAHRIVWSVAILAPLLTGRRFRDELLGVLRDRQQRRSVYLATALILVNWLTYVWAIISGRVLDTSLGYFLAPLALVLLGLVVLGERLRPAQAVAVGLAALAVAWLLVASGQFPWVALLLSSTFGLYGLVKKRLRISAAGGMFLECLLSTPAALAILAWQATTIGLAILDGPALRVVLLVAAGGISVGPLMLFAIAARGLPLVTLGLLQYIAPSVLFLLAVLVLGEPISAARVVGFAIIWVALAVYTADAWRNARPSRPRITPRST